MVQGNGVEKSIAVCTCKETVDEGNIGTAPSHQAAGIVVGVVQISAEYGVLDDDGGRCAMTYHAADEAVVSGGEGVVDGSLDHAATHGGGALMDDARQACCMSHARHAALHGEVLDGGTLHMSERCSAVVLRIGIGDTYAERLAVTVEGSREGVSLCAHGDSNSVGAVVPCVGEFVMLAGIGAGVNLVNECSPVISCR